MRLTSLQKSRCVALIGIHLESAFTESSNRKVSLSGYLCTEGILINSM